MNSTSCGSRLVSSAARSPARAITGPEVARKPTDSSRATICASVVLPSPGGPKNSTWSSGSPRWRAAATKTRRLARSRSWPTKFSRLWGRSSRSASASAPRGETRRLSPVTSLMALVPASACSSAPSAARSSRQLLQAALDEGFERNVRAERAGRLGDCGEGFAPLVAEPLEGRDGILGRRRVRGRQIRLAGHRSGHLGRQGDPPRLVLQLRADPRRQLGTDTVGPADRRLVLGGDRLGELQRRQHRQDRQGAARADALHRGQQAEPVPLGGFQEAIEVDVLLADVGFDQQARRAARRRQHAECPARAEHQIADAADVENKVLLTDAVDAAGQLADHARLAVRRAGSPQCTRVAAWWAWQIA